MSGDLAKRWQAAGEVALIVGLILLIIWVVKPLHEETLDRGLRVLAVALMLGSTWIHGDSRQRLGLRLDNFGPALARVSPLSVVAMATSLGAGAAFGSIRSPRGPVAFELAYYFVWAMAQQYGLNAVALRRLEDAGCGGSAPFVAAALFSLLHAPNPALMILTFLGAWLWCTTFRRHPNLFALAISHACLAVTIVNALPPQVTGGLHIGRRVVG